MVGVNALTSAGQCHVSHGTQADVVPNLVVAHAGSAQLKALFALVDVQALGAGIVQLVAIIAGAYKGAKGVGAMAVDADVGVLLAFVDVLQNNLSDVI